MKSASKIKIQSSYFCMCGHPCYVHIQGLGACLSCKMPACLKFKEVTEWLAKRRLYSHAYGKKAWKRKKAIQDYLKRWNAKGLIILLGVLLLASPAMASCAADAAVICNHTYEANGQVSTSRTCWKILDECETAEGMAWLAGAAEEARRKDTPAKEDARDRVLRYQLWSIQYSIDNLRR